MLDGATTHGFTLVEMMVVVAILGLTVGIGGLALVSLRPPPASVCVLALKQAKTKAVRDGIPVRAASNCSVLPAPLFFPDGRAIGPGVDPLTGAPRATR